MWVISFLFLKQDDEMQITTIKENGNWFKKIFETLEQETSELDR